VGKAKRAHDLSRTRKTVGTALTRLCPPYDICGWGTTAPHRHCERSEAIQTVSADTFLDCFVASLLAMTAERLRDGGEAE